MRRLLLAFVALTPSTALFAIPLTVLVIQESEKIADTIRAFNKECPAIRYDAQEQQWQKCREKRIAIAESLAGFIILANEELDILPENPCFPALLTNACQKENERISTAPFLLWHFSLGDKIENCSAQFLAVCWMVHVEFKVHHPSRHGRPI